MIIKKEVYKTLKFFTYVILFTWMLWIPSVLNSMGYNVPVLFLIISMVASFTPSVLGLFFTYNELGKNKFKLFLKSSLSFRNDYRLYIIVTLLFPLMAGLSYYITLLIEPRLTSSLLDNPVMIPVVLLQIALIGGALGEEFGWRGYALDKLQSKFSPFISTLILGIVWSVWHMPLFFMVGTVQSNIPMWQFMIQNTVIAFFYTWIFNKSNKNILLMIILHAVANTSAAVFPYWQYNSGRYIGLLILLITLAIIYLFEKRIKNGKII